jgi:hypothetical protein
VKEHGQEFFEPVGHALKRNNLKSFSPMNPGHLWKLRKEMWSYGKWVIGRKLSPGGKANVSPMDARLKAHVEFALQGFRHAPNEISTILRKYQLKLADRQCRMAELSQRIQDNVTILITALAAQNKSEAHVAAADFVCHDLRRKLTGQRPKDRYFREAMKLADMVIEGGFEEIAKVDRSEILMKY